MAKLTVGQKLYWVSVYGNAPHWVTVTKVGKKWAYLDNKERVGVNDLMADGKGYSSHATCYFSKELYEETVELAKAWGELKRDITNHSSARVTIEDIKNARTLLGLSNSYDW